MSVLKVNSCLSGAKKKIKWPDGTQRPFLILPNYFLASFLNFLPLCVISSLESAQLSKITASDLLSRHE